MGYARFLHSLKMIKIQNGKKCSWDQSVYDRQKPCFFVRKNKKRFQKSKEKVLKE